MEANANAYAINVCLYVRACATDTKMNYTNNKLPNQKVYAMHMGWRDLICVKPLSE